MSDFTHVELMSAATQKQIDMMLAHGSRVLELGSGWSTYLFARTGAVVTTVDNGPAFLKMREVCAGLLVTSVYADANTYEPDSTPDVIFIDFGYNMPDFPERCAAAARLSSLAPVYVHDLGRMNTLTRWAYADTHGTMASNAGGLHGTAQ